MQRPRAFINVQLTTICVVVQTKCAVVKSAIVALSIGRLPGFVQL